MLGAMTSLTGGGGMPVDAGGGSAGPSTATSESNMGFRVGAINMGGGGAANLSSWLPVLLALIVVWFLLKKVG
ncbi:hypothetical protein MD588_18960 [Photobacterium sp. SDRW27]|nr:hypothetical protein [Photobacterium obscurum]MCW8330877.1 hypothetical protein [Photobacterium obscurum]